VKTRQASRCVDHASKSIWLSAIRLSNWDQPSVLILLRTKLRMLCWSRVNSRLIDIPCIRNLLPVHNAGKKNRGAAGRPPIALRVRDILRYQSMRKEAAVNRAATNRQRSLQLAVFAAAPVEGAGSRLPFFALRLASDA